MDRMVYVAMSGAKQTMLSQTAVAHDLANISTTGFRASMQSFGSEEVAGPGMRSRVNTIAGTTGWDMSQGAMHDTGRSLDVAVRGPGWIAVQAPDGSEAYTRAGDLRIGSGGVVTTGAGHPVLGDGGPLAIPPAESLEIGADGTVSIVPLGQSAATLAVVDRVRLVNPPAELMQKGADGLMRMRDDSVPEADAEVRLDSGVLESSNVNAARTLVSMIELQRHFEMQVKAIESADGNARAAARLARIG